MSEQSFPTDEQFEPIEAPTDHPTSDEPDTTPLYDPEKASDGVAIEKEDGTTEVVQPADEPPAAQ